jgi:single-stranded-DNA-specific exonuclease
MMNSKIWKFKDVDDQEVRQIIDLTGVPCPIAKALALRQHCTEDDLETFLTPRLAGLSDPFLLPAMEKAVGRIWAAIESGESIIVFGDYDVDGITSTALLTRALGELGAKVYPFIPNRLDEGYGLSQEALARCLTEQAATLVITVDCGTNSTDSIDFAKTRGVDVIVTDHHEPDLKPAEPYALVNPKTAELDIKSDLTNLSGVGVAFKLVHGLIKTGREANRPTALPMDLRHYLDIVALGTVSDLVPLIGENRILVRHGLSAFDRTKWEGLRALKAVAGLRGSTDTYHLGYQLGPRINAAGRIGQPLQAIRLLTTDNAFEANEIAELLDRTNIERRKLEQNMAEEAFAEIDEYFDPENDFGLVVARSGWHPGVVGIVASRIARHYNRPSIVMGIDEDQCARGSCRSIAAYNILEGLRACDALLTQYGGHKMAAGVQVPASSVDAFRSEFNAAVSSELKSRKLVPELSIDACLEAEDLSGNFFKQLQRLQPFGQDNSEPVWAMINIELSGKPRVVGKKHLKLSFHIGSGNFDAIAFNYPLDQLPAGRLNVAFTLRENEWKGRTSLQLQIKDIQPGNSESAYDSPIFRKS